MSASPPATTKVDAGAAPALRAISFVLPDGMGLGGVTNWTMRMAGALAAQGRPTRILEHVSHLTDHQEPLPQTVLHLRHRGPDPLHWLHNQDIASYLPVYRRLLPGVIIPNFSPGAYAACAALSQTDAEGFRILGFAHSDEDYYYDLLAYYEPIIHRFVAVSQEIARNLQARLPQRQYDISVRPYGIDVPTRLQRAYTHATQPLQLVYAGRLAERQKRVSDLVKLTQALQNLGVDFQLRIVGDGRDRDKLVRSFESLGRAARERVLFSGRLPARQMAGVWRIADICILASEYEGTSIAMLEAMAQGCVPVVTRVSGAEAAISHGDNGFLVEVGDIERMAAIICSLAQDRRRLHEMGRNSWRRVCAAYGFTSYAEWFVGQCDDLSHLPPRLWPASRSILPKPYRHPGLLASLPRRISRRAVSLFRRTPAGRPAIPSQ